MSDTTHTVDEVEAPFSIAFEGPSLDAGTIEIRDLAPALLALSELFGEIHSIVYPDDNPVAVKIKATEHGSFLVDLILTQSILDRAISLLNSDEVSAVLNLKELVTASGVGVFATIRLLKHRRITSSEEIEGGQARLTLEDGETLEVPIGVAQSLRSMNVRRTVEEVVKPLNRDGIAALVFGSGGTKTTRTTDLTITSDDATLFRPPTAELTQLDEGVRRLFLSVVAPNFNTSNWRLSEGHDSASFYVAVEDHDFLSKVANGGISFSKGDLLEVEMRTVQSRGIDGTLTTDRTILEVYGHTPRSQGQLF